MKALEFPVLGPEASESKVLSMDEYVSFVHKHQYLYKDRGEVRKRKELETVDVRFEIK